MPAPALQPDVETILQHMRRQVRGWDKLGEHRLGVRLISPDDNVSRISLTTETDEDSMRKMAEDMAYWNAKGRNVFTVRNVAHINSPPNIADKDIIVEAIIADIQSVIADSLGAVRLEVGGLPLVSPVTPV